MKQNQEDAISVPALGDNGVAIERAAVERLQVILIPVGAHKPVRASLGVRDGREGREGTGRPTLWSCSAWASCPRAEEVISENYRGIFFHFGIGKWLPLCMCTGQTQKDRLAFVKCSYPELLYDAKFLDMACTCSNETLGSTVLACLRNMY